MTANEKTKIVIADDHKMLRESLCMLLDMEDDFEVVGQAADGVECMKLLQETETDILLLDISMPRVSGLEVAREMYRSRPQIKTIILTMHKNEEMLADAFSHGAKGYVLKENAFEELAQAIRSVRGGKIYVSQELAPILLTGFMENERAGKDLSTREMEVLKLLAEGNSNKEIAEILSISVKTVENHRANIMHKHNFRNITELVLYAVRNHIIEV
ncbi:MAG: response regulator transcription factor [Eubacteriales bacterium]|jgi:DNA-binding NarL/FixJ family response regulator|nr:response regulator transcription factor [Eubacteriales bacterium]